MTTAAREAEEIFQGEDILFPSTRAAISCILKFIFKFCVFFVLGAGNIVQLRGNYTKLRKCKKYLSCA